MNVSKTELICLVDSLRDFLKTFDQASKYTENLLPKPTVETESKKPKDNLFAHYYNDIIEHPMRQIRLFFQLGNSNFCVFSIKTFELHWIQVFLTEIVNLNQREIYHSLQEPILRCKQLWNIWEQLRWVVHSPLILGMTIALVTSLGTFLSKYKVLG